MASSSSSPPSAPSSHITKTILSPHPTKAFQHLDILRREERFIDITLETEGIKFPAHKAVLCACSPYFDRMFRPEFQEGELREVSLKGSISPDTLKILLEFMYTAKITVNEENAQDVLAGGNLLLLPLLIEAACEVLSKMLDQSNCLAIRSLASAYSQGELEKRAENYILERFESIWRSQEFLETSHIDVRSLLSSDDIIVKNEESIWSAILKWVSLSNERRDQHFEDLLRTCLRVPLLQPSFVNEVILTHALVKDELKGFIGASIGSKTTYRGSNKLLFLQCGNNSPWLITQPVLFDFKRSTWSLLPAPMKYREGTSFVSFENASILSMGGEYNVEPEAGNEQVGGAHTELILDREVYSLKLGDREWSSHSFLQIPRKRHASVMYKGDLYVLGGVGIEATPLSSVEVYRSSDWTWGPSMLKRRVSHGVVELRGELWVLGGWDGQSVVKTVEKLSGDGWVEVRIRWEEEAVGNPLRMKMGVAVLDGKIYTVGGCLQTLDPCYSAHVLDPIKKIWKELPNMKYSRNNPVLVPYRGKLYVFGGEGNSQGIVEVYDPANAEWTVLGSKIKHFANAAYGGTLLDKPWDWDISGRAEERMKPFEAPGSSNRNMQIILSGIGLDVVQTMRSHNLF